MRPCGLPPASGGASAGDAAAVDDDRNCGGGGGGRNAGSCGVSGGAGVYGAKPAPPPKALAP